MVHLEFLKLRLDTLMWRYYLLMALVIGGGFSGQWWISALALPVFLSAIMGIRISFSKPKMSIVKRMKSAQKVEQRKAS